MKDKKLKERKDTAASEQNSDSEDAKDIDVDFEFMPASDIDYHGLKTLLKQVFSNDVDIQQDLVEELIKDSIVIKSDSLDPIAFISLMDLKHKILKSIKDLLLKKVKNEDFNAIFDKRVGLLFNDRLINMPAQLVPNLFRQFFDYDYKFDYVVYLSKVYQKTDEGDDSDDEDDEGGSEGASKLKTAKLKRKRLATKQAEYFQEEDEFIEKSAILSFDYQLDKTQKSDSKRAFYDHGVHSFRRVFVMKMSSIEPLMAMFEKELV